MATASGMPDYQWLTVDYPYALDGEWEDGEVKRLAAEVAPLVLARLTAAPGSADITPRSG
jgi:hypothetical protein